MRRLPAEERERMLERLMSVYGNQVMRTCLLFLRSRTLAEDASQETFIRAWKAIDRLKEGTTEKAWLLKISVNVCKSVLNSRSYKLNDQKIPEERIAESGTEDCYSDDTVYRSVNALPVRYRLVVVLFYYQGLSVRETASVLHLPEATVRTRLSRARVKLKEDLKGWYFGDE